MAEVIDVDEHVARAARDEDDVKVLEVLFRFGADVAAVESDLHHRVELLQSVDGRLGAVGTHL